MRTHLWMIGGLVVGAMIMAGHPALAATPQEENSEATAAAEGDAGTDWDDPNSTWENLNYAVGDPNYYGYNYDSKNVGIPTQTYQASEFPLRTEPGDSTPLLMHDEIQLAPPPGGEAIADAPTPEHLLLEEVAQELQAADPSLSEMEARTLAGDAAQDLELGDRGHEAMMDTPEPPLETVGPTPVHVHTAGDTHGADDHWAETHREWNPPASEKPSYDSPSHTHEGAEEPTAVERTVETMAERSYEAPVIENEKPVYEAPTYEKPTSEAPTYDKEYPMQEHAGTEWH